MGMAGFDLPFRLVIKALILRPAFYRDPIKRATLAIVSLIIITGPVSVSRDIPTIVEEGMAITVNDLFVRLRSLTIFIHSCKGVELPRTVDALERGDRPETKEDEEKEPIKLARESYHSFDSPTEGITSTWALKKVAFARVPIGLTLHRETLWEDSETLVGLQERKRILSAETLMNVVQPSRERHVVPDSTPDCEAGPSDTTTAGEAEELSEERQPLCYLAL